MRMRTAYKKKKGYCEVQVPKKALKYGKRYGVSRAEAEKAYIKGFMSNARKKRNTKYKNCKGIDFIWR